MKSARLSVYLSELGPLIRKRVLLPPFGPRGETHSLAGEGDPILTKGQTLWYSMYTIIPLRLANTAFVNFVTVGRYMEWYRVSHNVVPKKNTQKI
jgi:hypothetical protein